MRGLQPGGHVPICYPYSRYPLQAQTPFNWSVTACHIFDMCPRIWCDSMPAGPTVLKKLPSRPGFEPRPARDLSLSAQQALWPI